MDVEPQYHSSYRSFGYFPAESGQTPSHVEVLVLVETPSQNGHLHKKYPGQLDRVRICLPPVAHIDMTRGFGLNLALANCSSYD